MVAKRKGYVGICLKNKKLIIVDDLKACTISPISLLLLFFKFAADLVVPLLISTSFQVIKPLF